MGMGVDLKDILKAKELSDPKPALLKWLNEDRIDYHEVVNTGLLSPKDIHVFVFACMKTIREGLKIFGYGSHVVDLAILIKESFCRTDVTFKEIVMVEKRLSHEIYEQKELGGDGEAIAEVLGCLKGGLSVDPHHAHSWMILPGWLNQDDKKRLEKYRKDSMRKILSETLSFMPITSETIFV